MTEVSKGKKRKTDSETHAHWKKQVATEDSTKRVSERQRTKK